jgi:transposase-like protein
MTISFARHQFPRSIIRQAVWLYVRFTLSYRDVDDLLAERGLDVSYETVRRWVLKFGPLFARELRHRRPRPTARWHLDEMAVTISGRRFWLWRAVDDEGEVLDLLVQRRRDKAAAAKLLRKLADQHHLFGITSDTNSFLAKFQSPFVRVGTFRTMHTPPPARRSQLSRPLRRRRARPAQASRPRGARRAPGNTGLV